MTTEHFAAMMEARIVPPPPDPRNFAERLHAAGREWREAEKLIRSYADRRTPMNGAGLFLHLSAMMRELIDDAQLHARLLQHLEQKMKSEFPPPPGNLFSA